jgi:hypothetical protein
LLLSKQNNLIRDLTAGMKELDESIKPRLMDAPPDCLDIRFRAPRRPALAE